MKLSSFHPNVRIRIYVNFATTLAFSMVIPFMPIYFAEKMGSVFTGLFLSISVISGFAGGVFSGYYADKTGRKKLMVISELIWVTAYFVMAFANSPWYHSPELTFVMVVLVSIGWGLYNPASEAMLLDVTKPEERKIMYGLFYWSNNLCIAVGGVAGAMLFKPYLFELLAGLTLVSLLSLLITIFKISETHFIREKIFAAKFAWNGLIKEFTGKYRLIFRDYTFMVYILSSLLLLSLEFQLTNYIGVRLSSEMKGQSFVPWKFQFLQSIDGLQMLGFLRTENTLLVVIFSLFMAAWMRRYLEKNVLLVSFALYIIGYTVLGFSNQPLLLLAAMLLATLGEVMSVPIRQAYLGDIAPDHARSSYLAVNSIVVQGAMLTGALGITLGGLLPSWVMASLMFLAGTAGATLFLLLVPRMEARRTDFSAASAGDLALQEQLPLS